MLPTHAQLWPAYGRPDVEALWGKGRNMSLHLVGPWHLSESADIQRMVVEEEHL